MLTLISINNVNWVNIGIIAAVVLVVIILVVVVANKGRSQARYRAFYKKMDKVITKSYNANLLNEAIINQYATDRTNTFKAMRGKGKGKVKKYFDY